MDALQDRVLHKMRRAIIDYGMIADEGGIMVGLSGGKDSSTLLWLLKEFLVSSKYKFPLAAGHVALRADEDTTPLADWCRSLDIPFYCERTQIQEIVLDVRKEKNPCSLCAKMRRGALNDLARKHGFAKTALAHHLDDAVETLLLNTFFVGRMQSFRPLTWLDRSSLTVIRPLVYCRESEVAELAKTLQLPVFPSRCPIDGKSKRQEMKELLANLEEIAPGAKEKALTALKENGRDGW